MKRYLIIAAVVLLMVIVGIFVYFYNSIDQIVESAIETEGSRVLGTKVSVGSVDISLKSGRGTIRDIEVANPDGFSSGEMFTLREATVDINVKSLNRDPITIDEIRISAPDVHVEMDERGGSNVAAVKKAVEQYQSVAAPKDRKQDSGFEKRFRIEKFTFEEGAVHLDASKLGVKPVETTLPPLRLSDVGGSNGDTPDGIGKRVSRAFLNSVSNVVAQEAKQRAVSEIKTRGMDFIRDALGDTTRK
jgi:CCR4-NOT transcriptional regulation complex NOT5 subunit